MNSLTSASSKRSYDHAIREFIDWYRSEPRLAFNRTLVTRYRIALEQRPYAPSTINLRLAAIRRLAYEASDCGLLSPDLAAGIRRVKGVRRLGVCVGNGLTAEEGKKLLRASESTIRPEGFLPPISAPGAKVNAARHTGKTYTPRAITSPCAYTVTHPGPRTSNGSSILTRPSVGRS